MTGQRERLPQRRPAETLNFRYRGHIYTATLGYYDFEMGRLGEVFLSTGKSGTDVDVATRDSAIALSLALQYGCPLEVIAKAFLRDAEGNPEGPLGVLAEMILSRNGGG